MSDAIALFVVYGLLGCLAVSAVIAIAWLGLPMIFDSLVGQFVAPFLLVKHAFDMLSKRQRRP
ncbi:MAG: hypothetical protein QM759_17985 [Terricaulis sp.]